MPRTRAVECPVTGRLAGGRRRMLPVTAPLRQRRPAAGAARRCGLGRSASRSTSSAVSTRWILSARLMLSGTSRRSGSLAAGMMHGGDAAAHRGAELLPQAADREHPPGQRDLAGHRQSERIGRPVNRLASTVAIVTPAEGPSFGIAPSGKCTCTSALAEAAPRDAEVLGAAAHPRGRGLHRLDHHGAELAGDLELARPRHRDRLDREQVAAGAPSRRGRWRRRWRAPAGARSSTNRGGPSTSSISFASTVQGPAAPAGLARRQRGGAAPRGRA